MPDECRNCTVRGDIGKCRDTECSIHESWYALKQDGLIRELVGALDTLVSRVNKYADRCDYHGPSWEFTKLVNDAESSIEALARARQELKQ